MFSVQEDAVQLYLLGSSPQVLVLNCEDVIPSELIALMVLVPLERVVVLDDDFKNSSYPV